MAEACSGTTPKPNTCDFANPIYIICITFQHSFKFSNDIIKWLSLTYRWTLIIDPHTLVLNSYSPRVGSSDVIMGDLAHLFSRVCGWGQFLLEGDVGRKEIIYISSRKSQGENIRKKMAPNLKIKRKTATMIQRFNWVTDHRLLF